MCTVQCRPSSMQYKRLDQKWVKRERTQTLSVSIFYLDTQCSQPSYTTETHPSCSGKKRVFPRFHFMSEADLLDILSNGNHPTKVVKHIDKLMLSTKSLVLEDVPGNISDRPRAIRFIAKIGDEIIDFEPAVFLEGKVRTRSNRDYFLHRPYTSLCWTQIPIILYLIGTCN